MSSYKNFSFFLHYIKPSNVSSLKDTKIQAKITFIFLSLMEWL